MQINPIIPIWLMAVICVAICALKRKGIVPYIRQVVIAILLFVINLRIMVPTGEMKVISDKLGTYVLFVVDDTISMVAEDGVNGKERLADAKETCDHIIDKLYGSKFGVVTFNNKAYLNSPFTNDGEYARNLIESVAPLNQYYAQGTSINVCKDVLVSTLKTAYDKADGDVVVFFLSDGEITNGDTLTSFSECSKYISNGAVLGYGTSTGGKMYVVDYSGSKALVEDRSSFPYQPAVSRIDENNLKSIADDMGITYLNMSKMNKFSSLDTILDKIRSNAETEGEERTVSGYMDIYFYFVIPLALLVIFEFVDFVRRKNEKA